MRGKVLSDAQIEQFIECGYAHVEEAFPREAALRAQQDVWPSVEEQGPHRNDPATWDKPMVHLRENFETPAFQECKTERLKQAVEDLVGIGRWRSRDVKDGWGWWPVNFSMGADRPWGVPKEGWHWDGIQFRHYVDSPDQGLLLLCIFSDIRSHGGATLVAEGSHKVTARFLNAHPEGFVLNEGIHACQSSHPWLAELTGTELKEEAEYNREEFAAWQQSGSRNERFLERPYSSDRLLLKEAVGGPGDIYLCHPMLYHAASQNHLGTPRFMCNRTTSLCDKMLFDRPDGSYSPVETSIRRALGKENQG